MPLPLSSSPLQVGDDASKLPASVVFAAYITSSHSTARVAAFQAIVASAVRDALDGAASAGGGGGGRRKVLVFSERKAEACELATMRIPGVRLAALTGDLSQGQREAALADFKAGRVDVICATDGEGRGGGGEGRGVWG